jgi:hypothetical protein
MCTTPQYVHLCFPGLPNSPIFRVFSTNVYQVSNVEWYPIMVKTKQTNDCLNKLRVHVLVALGLLFITAFEEPNDFQ